MESEDTGVEGAEFVLYWRVSGKERERRKRPLFVGGKHIHWLTEEAASWWNMKRPWVRGLEFPKRMNVVDVEALGGRS